MELRLSELAGTTSEAVITVWHVAENEHVAKDQDILEVSTDKATFDVPSPCDGIVARILKKEGETVRTDEMIAEIQEDRRQ